jgi:hypothetical protein
VPFPRTPAATGEKWLCCIDCCRCAVCCWNDSGCDELCVPKKCCDPLLRMVEGAAARPLADKLARVGTTGMFPVIMRALLNCACVAATAVVRPAPNFPAPTVETALLMCASLMCARFENWVPACSGAIPPKWFSVPK